MNFKESLMTIGLIAAGVVLGGSILGAVIVAAQKPAPQAALGSADTVVLPFTPTATKVWVGTSDTVVIGSSTGRVRLEVGNISGATSSPQALYCNVGDRPSVAFEGMVIQASSSYAFTLDNLMRGALRCRFPNSAATVTVIDY